LEFISEYDFEIKHIQGKENKVDDAVERRVHKMHARTISMCKSNLIDRIYEFAKLDQHFKEIMKILQQGNSQQRIKYYELREDGILVYRGIIYVPNFPKLKNMVLR